MRDNYSYIVFVLDRSSSMSGMRERAINGYNELLDQQLAEPGEADIQLVLFNQYRSAEPLIPLKDARRLDNASYVPSGMTALYDAVGISIQELGEALAAMPEDQRPSKVIFAVLTDGEENSSREFPGIVGRRRLAEMIKKQQEEYQWEFFFLGANIDAPAIAVSLNIPVDNAMNFVPTNVGISEAYTVTSSNLARARKGN